MCSPVERYFCFYLIFFLSIFDNRCIFGVFGWDFGLVLSKVFVACVRQLNAIFVFLSNFENVPRRSGFRRCAR